jgi:hypothetical protein
MIVLVNTPFELEVHGADTGLVGTISIEIYDPETTAGILGPFTSGITEPRPGTYLTSVTVPIVGNFIARWSYPDPVDASLTTAEEDIIVATTDVPEVREDAIDTPIGTQAHDLLPETWEALSEAKSFGANALLRAHDRVVNRVFGRMLSIEEQEILPSRVIEFAGKMLALYLLDPGIEYWSRQVISRTVGERESSAYKDRAEDLRLLKKEWTAQLADLFLDIRDLLPVLPGRAGDMPRVVLPGQLINTIDNPRTQGEQVAYATANPYDLEPMYGPPEETA